MKKWIAVLALSLSFSVNSAHSESSAKMITDEAVAKPFKDACLPRIKARLKDPESAQIKNVYVIRKEDGNVSVMYSMNAKNSYGGYTGYKLYYCMITNDLEITAIY